MVVLQVHNKREAVGNLFSAKLADDGIEYFSFGEFFEANPLLKIHKKIKVNAHDWIDGIPYRSLELDGNKLSDSLVVFKDDLLYTLVNKGEKAIRLKASGEVHVFSPFGRQKFIAKSAGVHFKRLSFGVLGSYGKDYHLYIASNKKISANIKTASLTFTMNIDLNSGKDFILIASASESPDNAILKVKELLTGERRIEGSKREYIKKMLEKVSSFSTGIRNYDKLWLYMWYVILTNRAKVWRHPILAREFTMPSKFTFRHQWLWDSAFHSIVLSYYDIKLAEEELINLFKAQKPDGRIPHEIFLSKELCKLFWNVDDYSPWTTQPPVIAIAVKRLMEAGCSRDFLKIAFNALDKYDKWFRKERDADDDQLMAYVDYLESGWDNSVRWDYAISRYNREHAKYKYYKNIRMTPVEAIDLNCFIYIQRKVLSEIAARLGIRNKEYTELAKITLDGIRKYMWDPSTNFYYDIYEDSHKMIKVKSPAAFITLFAGIATKEQAEKIIKHLFNPNEFWTKFPLPTVSADNPKYNPKDYWRGRSWINQVWFTYFGLKKYGFLDEARKLAQRVLDIMSEGPTCNENYDSSTGKPLGAIDFGWSTLMLTIIRDL